MSSENEPKRVEELRQQLNELNRQLLVQMGNIEDMEKCIAAIRKEAVELYKEIDAKLNGDEDKQVLLKGQSHEEQNCDTAHSADDCH